MKTIEEELNRAKEYARNTGLYPDDAGYWAATVGWFKASMERREKEYQREINNLNRAARDVVVNLINIIEPFGLALEIKEDENELEEKLK